MRITDRQRALGICVALAALVWAVFGQAVRFEFLNYDDPQYVAANPAINAGLTWTGWRWALTNPHGGNWHPLTSLSHMLDAQLFGLNPAGHHAVNVALHMLAAVLLFLLLRQLTGRTWESAFVAAVFAIHPLRAESVGWVSERKDVLSAVFFMLTLAAYARFVRQRSLGNYLLVSAVFVLGLMAKPMLVTLPFVLLLLDYWPLKRFNAQRSTSNAQRPTKKTPKVTDQWAVVRGLLFEKLPLFILAAGSGVATLIAQKEALGSVALTPFSSRLANAIVACVIYLGQFFRPARLAVFYPYPEDGFSPGIVVSCGAILGALSVGAVIYRKRFPFLFVGWFWYVIMLLPVLGLIQVGRHGHADRFTYLPQIGIAIAGTWGIAQFTRSWRYRQEIVGTVAACLVVLLGFMAHAQAGTWRNSETLWRHTLAVTKRNDVAHTNLSEIYLKNGRPEDAIREARAALEIYPGNAQAANNLGVGLLRTHHVGEALRYFEQSVRQRPDGVNATQTLAWILAATPDPNQRNGKRAVELAERAAQLTNRQNVIVLHTLAASYAAAHRFPEAIRVGEEVIRLATEQGRTDLMEELRISLDSYRKNRGLRDLTLLEIPEGM